MKNLFVKLLLILGLTASLQASQPMQIPEGDSEPLLITQLRTTSLLPPAWAACTLCFVPLFLYYEANGACFRSGAQSVWYNRAMPQMQGLDIKSMEEQMGSVPFGWWVREEDQADDAAQLTAAGYVKYNNLPEHGMYISLNPLPEEKVKNRVVSEPFIEETNVSKKNPSITVHRIDPRDEDSVNLWIKTSAAGFAIGVSDVTAFVKTFGGYLNAFSFYLAYLDGVEEPVSSCMMMRQEYSFVTIHQLSTVPKYRCQGLGHAIVTQALADAKADNYYWAILLSSPDNPSTNSYGHTLFTNLGFQANATYDIYVSRHVAGQPQQMQTQSAQVAPQGWGPWVKDSCLVS
jgi:predicted N-acetyltransferase YhbS